MFKEDHSSADLGNRQNPDQWRGGRQWGCWAPTILCPRVTSVSWRGEAILTPPSLIRWPGELGCQLLVEV